MARRAWRERARRGVQVGMVMLFRSAFFHFSPLLSALGACEAVVTGKRAPCRLIFLKVRFMVFGRFPGNPLRAFAIRLRAGSRGCTHLGRCSPACPKSLEVQPRADSGARELPDRVLCGEGACIYPKKLISYPWGRQ